MVKEKRFWALFLALALTLSLFPTMAFANGGEGSEGSDPFVATFYANGGAFSDGETTKSTETDDDGYVYPPEDPTRAGYYFVGWSYYEEQNDETINLYRYDESVDESYPTHKITEDKAFYAQWEEAWTLTFDANGGYFGNREEGTDTESVVQICRKTQNYCTEPAKYPEKDGFGFIGWSTKPEGGEIITFDDNPYFPRTVYENTIIYAQWREKVTVTFDPNGGYYTGEYALLQNDDGKYVTTAIAGQNTSEYPYPKHDGNYIFAGWFIDDDEQITSTFEDGYYVVNEETIFKAKWVKGDAVAFESDELDLDMSDLCNYHGKDGYDSDVYYTLELESGTADSFQSTKPSVVQIEELDENDERYGKATILHLRKPGSTTIRAYDEAGNIVAICQLTVTASIKDIEIRPYRDNGDDYYDDDDFPIAPGKELQLKAYSYPSFAPEPEVVWTSSNDEHATVDDNGLVRLNARGPVSISAETADGITDTYYIKWSDTITSDDYTYKVLDGNEAEIISYNGNAKVIEIPKVIDGYPVTSIYRIRDDKLTKVTVPHTVRSMASGAFYGCDRLQTVILNCDADIPDEAFMGCNYLKNVQINGHPRIIGKESFYDCGRLESITLPEGVEVIEYAAFNALKKIKLPQSLKIIESGAFGYYSSIETLNIGKNVESIGDAQGIQKFVVDSGNSKYASKGGVLFNKKMDTLLLYPGKGPVHYSVPSGTKTIGAKAFSYNGRMYQIDFPETLQAIKADALPGNSSLTLLLPKSLKTIDSNNMDSAPEKVYYRGSSSDWKNLAKGIDIIGNDGLKENKQIVYNYKKKGIKLSKTTVSCTYAERPTVALTYSDGSAVKYEDAHIYDNNYSITSADARKKGSGTEIAIYPWGSPYKKGTVKFCVVAGGFAKTLTVKVTGPTPLSKVKVTGLKAQEYTGKAVKNNYFDVKIGGNYIGSDNYSVKYKNNTNVGLATVILTGKNSCTGTIKKTFKILPKSTWITTSSSGKKSVTLKWKKISKQTTGYQIQYSLKQNFKNAKTVNITSYKTTKKKISKLKSNKWYYFRIRTYKKVGKKKYYSGWSGTHITCPQ